VPCPAVFNSTSFTNVSEGYVIKYRLIEQFWLVEVVPDDAVFKKLESLNFDFAPASTADSQHRGAGGK
jgi:hypothetical protein